MPRYASLHFPMEKLIAEVKKHPCLYDTADPEYNSLLNKTEAWRDIARKLHEDPKTLKMKWKNCRDSYLKYKRALKGSKVVHVSRYKEWPWTKYMKFLDHLLEVQPPKRNYPLRSGNNESQSEQLSVSEAAPSGRSVSPDTERTSEDDCEDNILLSSTSTQTIRKNGQCDQCVVTYLENKQNSADNQDEIGHLFLSYAKTFKRFTVRTQAKLKVQLAQLFAETELAELDEQHPTQSSSSFSITNSAPTDLTELSPERDVKPVSISENEF